MVSARAAARSFACPSVRRERTLIIFAFAFGELFALRVDSSPALGSPSPSLTLSVVSLSARVHDVRFARAGNRGGDGGGDVVVCLP